MNKNDELNELKRLVWLDFTKTIIGEEMMRKIDQEKLFEVVRSEKNWTLTKLESYIKANMESLIKEN